MSPKHPSFPISPPLAATTAAEVEEDPSFINVPIMAWLVVALWVVWFFVLSALLIWRRKVQPVKARSPLLLFLTICMTSFVVILSAIRYGVGRYSYPCFLYSLSFFMSQPGIFFPTILRSWRLFFVYHLSVIKGKAAIGLMHSETSSVKRTGSSTTAGSGEGSNAGSVTGPSESGDVEMHSVSDQPGNDDADAGETQSSVSTLTTKTTNAQGDSGSKRKSSRLKTALNVRAWKRSVRVYTFWVSMPFMLLLFGLMVVVHCIIWVAFSSTNATTYFSFTSGCRMETVALIIVVIQVVLYLVVELAMSIALITVRDQYNMRKEIYLNVIQWFVLIMVFLLVGVIPFVKEFSDVYLPSGFAIFLACFLDSFFSTFIPIMLSFRKIYHYSQSSSEEKNVSFNNELRFVLENDELRAMFKKFTVESFAPEILLAWEHAERYAKERNRSKRNRIGTALLNTFLDPRHAIMELNLSAEFLKNHPLTAMQEGLAERQSPDDLFVPLQRHCMLDLQDMFNRFKVRGDYLKAKNNLEAKTQLMQETGII